jgi:hypothetical protein
MFSLRLAFINPERWIHETISSSLFMGSFGMYLPGNLVGGVWDILAQRSQCPGSCNARKHSHPNPGFFTPLAPIRDFIPHTDANIE